MSFRPGKNPDEHIGTLCVQRNYAVQDTTRLMRVEVECAQPKKKPSMIVTSQKSSKQTWRNLASRIGRCRMFCIGCHSQHLVFGEASTIEEAGYASSSRLSLNDGTSDSLAPYADSSSFEQADAALALPADSQAIFECTEEQELATKFATILIDSAAILPKPTNVAAMHGLVLKTQGCLSHRTIVVTQSVAYSECVLELTLDRPLPKADGDIKRDIMRQLVALGFEGDRQHRAIKRDHSNRASKKKPSLAYDSCTLLEKIAKARAEIRLDKQRLREAARVRPISALQLPRKVA